MCSWLLSSGLLKENSLLGAQVKIDMKAYLKNVLTVALGKELGAVLPNREDRHAAEMSV